MYTIKTKKRGDITLLKNTLLIGENGSGKSSLIERVGEAIGIEFGGGLIPFDPKIDVLKVTNENLKDSIDGTKANFRKEIEASENHANSVIIPSTITAHPDLTTAISALNFAHGKSEEVISSSLKWNVSYEVADKLIQTICKFEFNGHTYDVSSLPSGVRKLIDIYFSVKSSSPNKRIVLLDEIDNFLHPNWVRLVAELISGFMSNENIILIISTHNQDLLYLLSDHIDFLGLPKQLVGSPRNFDVQYLDWDAALIFYNSFSSSTVNGFTTITLNEFKEKVKIRFSAEFAKALFSQTSKLIIVEGITDQQYFKNKTQNLIVNSFGWFNFGLILSILKGLNGNLSNINIIADGDDRLGITGSPNLLLKTRIVADGVPTFFFEKDLEQNIFGATAKIASAKDKFQLLQNNWTTPIPPSAIFDDLRNLLS